MKRMAYSLLVLVVLAASACGVELSSARAASTFTVNIDGAAIISPYDPAQPANGATHSVWVDLRQPTTFRLSAEAYNRDSVSGGLRIYTVFRTFNGGPWRSLSANGCGGVDAYTDATPVTQRDARASGVCPIFSGARMQNVELRIVAVKVGGSDGVYPQLAKSAIVQFFIP